ncbi:hypothetical protein [Desulfosoma caldarium]|uniref:Uncharacterized protein n=1 Tax=Desulfosoma caldarium TaxID=610254 RepID=A0A3N1UQ60_9BACT|nr:hypothetical protein [Desulfosoma caldarium]ROQ90890.1 hypothetical protein EDC27_2151 [Desulfosoma caldarium]
MLDEVVPYALAATSEVAEERDIDISGEVAARVNAARVRDTCNELGP